MSLRDLNWPAIAFGSAGGLFVSIVLFVVLFGVGENAVIQILILCFGFLTAGYIAGRFALTEPLVSGGLAALGLFFAVAVLTVTGDGLNVVGLVVFGTAAGALGPLGGAIGYQRAIR